MRGFDSRHLEAVRQAMGAESLHIDLWSAGRLVPGGLELKVRFPDGKVACYQTPQEALHDTSVNHEYLLDEIASRLFRSRLAQLKG